MGDVTYCSVCLATDVKMFEMSPTALRIYNELVAIQDNLSIKQMHACYECAYLLQKYAEFKTKCCRAYSILQSFATVSSEVTVENLKSIDRKQSKLESKLSTACVSTKYYLPVKKNECHAADKKGNIIKVKTESFIDSSDELEDAIYIREELQPSNNETGNLDDQNNDDNQEFCDDMKREFHVDNIQKHRIVKPFQRVNMLEVNCPDFDPTKDGAPKVNVGNIKLELELESTQENNIPNDVLSDDKLDLGSDSDELNTPPNKLASDGESNALSDDKLDFDSDSDNEELKKILSRYPAPDGSKATNSESKKRKITRQDKISTVKGKVTKKRKTEISIDKKKSDTNKKQTKKVSRNTTKSAAKKEKKDNRYSFDPSIYKDYATIVILTPEDAKNEFLLRKESANYKQCEYKCELCYRGYNTEATYQTHMNKHTLEYGSHECDICRLRFGEKKHLHRHRLVTHTRKFLCKICPYICYCPSQAKNHMCLHKGKKYPCKECDEVFKLPNSLLTHTRLKHSVELVCDLCGSTFGSKKGLEVHKYKLHRKEVNERQGPRCEECDVHFATEMAWKRHLVLCSKHGVSDGCGICGDIFPDAASLKAHTKQHGPRPGSTCYQKDKLKLPTTCKYCEETLTSTREYKHHMTTVHPQSDIAEAINKLQQKKCVCEICGMTFTQPCFLQVHQRKHTGEKPFSCPDCGKRFTTLHAVKSHQPVHTNIYPYKCHICDRPFGNKYRLNKHIKYHLGIRPHKCWGCDRTFLFKCEMNNHAQYVHGKVPWPKRDRTKRGSDAKE
ncbi:uncharacterized protein [Epargyreus clarus]|uniref:uncharacterized protein n=1 Tax=Epargyreus clarus TaxID=520877 RepID=UPI003C2CA33B